MNTPRQDISHLRRQGRAMWRQQGSQYQLRASHAIAALHLLGQTGKLEIHLTPGEVTRLEAAPRQKIRLSVADHQPSTLAQCAYTLLQQLPERRLRPNLLWLILLAIALAFLTFVLMDSVNQTHLIQSWW